MEKLFRRLVQQAGFKVESFSLNPKRHLNGATGRLLGADGKPYWGRLKIYDQAKINTRLLQGIEEAEVFVQVPKPQLVKVIQEVTDDMLARLEVLTFVPFAVLSHEPWLVKAPTLNDDWWQTFRQTVITIQKNPTMRIACRDELVQRRLTAWFPNYDKAYKTAACHGDMHWANVTGPTFFLLDWEDWGLAPLWYDPALLLAYSGSDEIAEHILTLFPELLPEGEGHTALLFAIAELLEMNTQHGDYPEIKPFLENLWGRFK